MVGIAIQTTVLCSNIVLRIQWLEIRDGSYVKQRSSDYQKGLLPVELRPSEVRAALEATAESSLDLSMDSSANYVHALDTETPTAALEILRGRLALRGNQTSEAIAHLTQATMLEPENVNAMYWLAIAKHSIPNDSEGDALLTRILQRDPRNLPGLASHVAFARDRRDWRTGAQAKVE